MVHRRMENIFLSKPYYDKENDRRGQIDQDDTTLTLVTKKKILNKNQFSSRFIV